MKPTRYIITYIAALLITVSICAALYLSSVQKYRECEITLPELELVCRTLQGQSDILSQENLSLSAQLTDLSTQLDTLQQQIDRKQDKTDRSSERPHYELSEAEYDLVERVVMAEAEDEPYKGKMLVCQCILNACKLNNKRPSEIVKQYAYAKRRPEPSESVKNAVTAVFDKGETVTNEAIIYFYAPALVESKFHEQQRFVCEVGGHRFFAEG